jgi:hypothetical protein
VLHGRGRERARPLPDRAGIGAQLGEIGSAAMTPLSVAPTATAIGMS